MSTLTKGPALGDIVLYETPAKICREEYEVTRVLAATQAYEVGTPMDFDAAVAAVQTLATVPAADGGTYRIGFRGLWTEAIAWGEAAAGCKTAFELISGGVIVTFSAAWVISGSTLTFANTVGNIPEVLVDDRLLTVGGVSMDGECVVTTTTVGELAVMKMVATAAANVDAVLLERVSLTDLQNASGEKLRRSFIMRGHVVLNATKIADEGRKHTAAFGTAAQTQTALIALGMGARLEPIMTDEGTPSS